MSDLYIHGARGSVPVSGPWSHRYGANTTCFSLETEHGILVFDAGTGLVNLGTQLNERKKIPPITIFLTHLHLDHVIGLPAFAPLRREDTHVTVMADAKSLGNWQEALRHLIDQPYWPVRLQDMAAKIELHDLPEATAPFEMYGVKLSWCSVWHPQGGTGFRLVLPNKTVVLATDCEHGHEPFDQVLRDFVKNVDVLIYDAQYTPEEYDGYAGWGHSTWEMGARLAQETGVKKLVLTSHHPTRSDDAIDTLLQQAKVVFPNTAAAAEGLIL